MVRRTFTARATKRTTRAQRLRTAATRHHNAKLSKKIAFMRISPHGREGAKGRKADATARMRRGGRKSRRNRRGFLEALARSGWDIVRWVTPKPGAWSTVKKSRR